MNQNILDHGAAVDGKTLSTVAIQKAIDTCAETGGGYVYIPQGEYLTGTVYLRSNVYLYLCPGSKLLGSMDITDYSGTKRGCAWSNIRAFLPKKNSKSPCNGLIVSEDIENCGILGEGIIDGQRNQEKIADPKIGKPFLVVFSRCKGVKVDGITLQNPGFFTVYTMACTDVIITKVRIYSEDTPSGDGLDFDGSRNVVISDCIIHAGDDAIGLKTLTPTDPCENFLIQNCFLKAKFWGCIRLGPESAGDMRHITVSNCVFYDSNDGLKLQLCEDAVFEHFNFSNIVMNQVVRPFFFTNNAYRMSMHTDTVRPTGGIMRYINVSNITADMTQRVLPPTRVNAGELHLSCNYLYNMPGNQTYDIKFSNMQINCVGGGSAEENTRADHGEMVDCVSKYPEVCNEVGVYPAAAMYIKNCSRISMENCNFRAMKYDARPAIAAEGATDLYFRRVSADNTSYLVREIGCTDLELDRCKGDRMPISDALQTAWEENRAAVMAQFEERKKLGEMIDRLSGASVVAEWDADNGSFEGEKDGRYWVYISLIQKDFSLLVNGKEVDVHRQLSKYPHPEYYVKEITDFVKSGENTVAIRLLSENSLREDTVKVLRCE